VNRSQIRALASDAFHQVLDNGVFRVLTVLCALPVLFTFVVGFREEGLVLLFGVKTWSYAELFGAFTHGVLPADPRGLLIEQVLQVVVGFLAGSLGMLVALSATSFFVPRMLEKGSAELYFHKPVARAALLLSRYVAGLLFVGLVSLVLVGGVYLGFLLASGHNDPGILVSALTLTYAFVPIYAFTVLAGVVTRSTVASLLLSSFFFLFNGCIHQGWIAWQVTEHGPRARLVREADAEEDAKAEGRHKDDAEKPGRADDEDESGDDARSPTAQVFLTVLDVLHLVLPKTTDAEVFGQKLRSALDAPMFRDERSLVTVARLPEGLSADARALDAYAPLRARLGEPLLVLSAGPDAALHSLWRRPAEHTETRFGERVRVRVETASQAAKSLAEELATRAVAPERESTHFGSSRVEGDIPATRVDWREGEGAAARTRSALVFKGTDDELVFTLLMDAPGELDAAAAEAERSRLATQVTIDRSALEEWYPAQLAFDAPLRFNILFSIGSTLVAALLLLALGAWRLSRIEF